MTESVVLSGELTICRADELVSTLRQALQSCQQLHIDLTTVVQLDTAAAQILVAAKQQALQTAVPVIFSCSPMVHERLRTIGIQL